MSLPRPLVEATEALGPDALVALRAATREVRAGARPIGDRFALSPFVLGPSEMGAFDRLARATHTVLRETPAALRADRRLLARLVPGPRALLGVRRRFDLGQAQWAAFGVPSFLVHQPVAPPDAIARVRADAFWIDGRPRVFELNVGSMLCAVMDELAAALTTLPAYATAVVGDARAPRSSAALAGALLRRHDALLGTAPTGAAQVDHPDASSGDADGLVSAWIARGVDVRRVGPGQITFARGHLRAAGEEVTLLSEESTALPPALARYGARARLTYKLARWRAMAGRAAIVHPPPYEALFHKGFLALVSEGALDGRVDDEALAVLREHVAWTREVAPGPIVLADGREADLRLFALEHRDELVLKPTIGHTAIGVLLGDRASPAQWERAIDEALLCRDAVIQERLRPAPFEILRANGARAEVIADLSPVFVDGETVAIFSRFDAPDALLRFLGGGGGLIPVWMHDMDESDG